MTQEKKLQELAMEVRKQKLKEADKTAAYSLLLSMKLQLANSPDSIEVVRITKNG